MDRSRWGSNLQAALNVGNENLITALDIKSKLQKEMMKTENHVITSKILKTLWQMVSIQNNSSLKEAYY